MITAQAIVRGNRNKLLDFAEEEHPIVLQIGGSDPSLLVDAAKIGEEFGYDEINLNVGCPSSRVSAGRFGACLMREPNLVAECVSKMQESVSVPVTVKTRIGVDELDSYEAFYSFIKTIADINCKTFVIHARKAWLHGLNPKQNREIPPLQYDFVYRIKKDFPHLMFILNGGINSIADIEKHIANVDGVMIGRSAYTNPFFLYEIQKKYFITDAFDITRHQVIESFIPYVEMQLQKGVRLATITRHLFGLYKGLPGANHWRRYLSEQAHSRTDTNVLKEALQRLNNY